LREPESCADQANLAGGHGGHGRRQLHHALGGRLGAGGEILDAAEKLVGIEFDSLVRFFMGCIGT
jgi:hypothetical protein